MTKLFCILLLVSFVAGGSLAQNSGTDHILLADQAWLVKNLKENGMYSDSGSDTSISEVSFTGCRLNLVTERTGSIGGWKITSTLSFDLTDIDARNISEGQSASRSARLLLLRTIDGDDVVSFNARSQHLAEVSRMDRSAKIVVRKKRTKVIKEKLMAVINACQLRARKRATP